MLIRASTAFIAFLSTVAFLVGSPACCGTNERAQMLATLSASPTRLAASQMKAKGKDLAALTLDLIVYRWAVRTAKNVPVDVGRIDDVISATTAELNDPLIRWALNAFAVSAAASVGASPPTDDRVAQLSELKRQYGMWALDYRQTSPIQSVNALVTVLNDCQSLDLDLSGALTRKMLGNLYHKDMARYRQAEDCYDTAGGVFSNYNCHESAAVLYNDYGALCWEMARYVAATEKYSTSAMHWVQLEKLFPSISRYRGMAGREYIKAGQAQSATGDSVNALRLMNGGLRELRNEAVLAKSYEEFIRNQIIVSDYYREQENLRKAIDLLGQAVNEFKYGVDPKLSSQVHQLLSANYRAMNLAKEANQESAKAERILQDAAAAGLAASTKLAASASLSAASLPQLELAANRGATALQELKKYPQAAAVLQQLLATYKQVGTIDEQIACLQALAAVMDLEKKPQESLNARLDATRLATKANKKTLAAEIISDMVSALIEIGDLNNALEALTELDPIVQQSGNLRRLGDVREGRGALLASHDRYDDAIIDYRKALDIYSTQIGDPWAAGRVSLKLAAALQAAKNPAEAQTVLESALKDIEDRYADENVDPNTDPERSHLVMGLYKELATLYVVDGKTESASNLMVSAQRFSWLKDLIAQLKTSGNPAVVSFAGTADVITSTPDPTTLPPETPSKATLLVNNWADFSTKCMALHEQDPRRYNALPINPLEFYKSRNDLPKKALIVAYLCSDYATYAFVCGNGVSRIWELGISSKAVDTIAGNLSQAVKACERKLAAGQPLPKMTDWQEQSFVTMSKPLISLYAKLVGPIARDLAPGQTLVFVLPDELAGTPMHALISSVKSNSPRFLIQDYEIGYLGQGMLNDLISKDSRPIDPSSDRLAIFADPAGNLPGARQEAAMIKDDLYYESAAYVGKSASVANFLKECDKAAILHIAVHYKIDPDPSKFVLQLAPDDGSNGEITVQQLSAITNPHLQLVVLSACESAASTDPLKSGASSAAEVFSLAGAKSVLGGLWKVTDAPASKLMGDFYRTLVRGKSRTESIQRAQIAMIEAKEYAHPFYWACFALYGNPW